MKAIGQILRNPWLLNHVLNDNSVWQQQVSRQYQMSNGLPVVAIDDLLPGFAESLHTFAFLDGGSLPTDLALLKGLCKKFDDCRYFEIGTWRGESIANVAECAHSCVALDLSAEELRKRGVSEAQIDLLAYFSKDLPNVSHLYGDSMTFDFSKIGPFDVIFIDGDHHYDYVLNDTQQVFQHLVHDESIVVWHDYAYNPEKVRYEVMAAILDGTPKAFHAHLYQVSNTLSAVFSKTAPPSYPRKIPTFPNKKFKVKIEI